MERIFINMQPSKMETKLPTAHRPPTVGVASLSIPYKPLAIFLLLYRRAVRRKYTVTIQHVTQIFIFKGVMS